MSSKTEKFADLSISNRILTLYINDTCGMNKYESMKSRPKRRPKLMEMLNAFNYNGSAFLEKLKGHGDLDFKIGKRDKYTDTYELSTTSDFNDSSPSNDQVYVALRIEEVSLFEECYKVPFNAQIGVVEVNLDMHDDTVNDLRYNSAEFSDNVLDIYQEIQDDIEKKRSNKDNIQMEELNQENEQGEEKSSRFVHADEFKDIIEDFPKSDDIATINDPNEPGDELDSLDISQEIKDDAEDEHEDYYSQDFGGYMKQTLPFKTSRPEYTNCLYDIDLDDPISCGAMDASIIHLKEVLNKIDDNNDWDDADLGNLDDTENFSLPQDGYFLRRPSTIIEENSGFSKTDISSSISSSG